MLIRIVGVRLSHFLGILAVSLGPYALMAWLLIRSGVITLDSLLLALGILSVVVVVAAVFVTAAEFTAEARARQRPEVRTPDTDPLELIALCVVVCVLWLGLGAYDHRSNWPTSYDRNPAEVRASATDR